MLPPKVDEDVWPSDSFFIQYRRSFQRRNRPGFRNNGNDTIRICSRSYVIHNFSSTISNKTAKFFCTVITTNNFNYFVSIFGLQLLKHNINQAFNEILGIEV